MNKARAFVGFMLAQAILVQRAEPYGICKDMDTPVQIEVCWAQRAGQAETTLDRYATACRTALSADPDALALFEKAQEAWAAYRVADCQAVSKHHKPEPNEVTGTRYLQCIFRHARERTNAVWAGCLAGTKSDLPEPKFDGAK